MNVFWQFANAYRPIHGWLATIVCIFGISANFLNIIVLTRPNLISSPTNLILAGLACSDLLTMLSSLPYNIHFSLRYAHQPGNVPHPERDSKAWTHFSKLHVMTSVTFHSISIWLTVYLACFRYIYLASSSPSYGNRYGVGSNQRRQSAAVALKTRLALVWQRFLVRCKSYNSVIVSMLLICLFCVVFCFPAYIYPEVKRRPLNETDSVGNSSANETAYVHFIGPSDLDELTNGFIFQAMFYSQAILAKFIPCILLVTFSSLLIKSLIIINRNKKRLNKRGINQRRKEEQSGKLGRFCSSFCCCCCCCSDNGDNSGFSEEAETLNSAAATIKINVEMADLSLKPSNDEAELKKSASSSVIESENLSVKTKLANLSRRLSEIRTIKRPSFVGGASKSSTTIINNNNNTNPNEELGDADESCSKRDKSVGTESRMFKPRRNKAKENLRTTLMLVIVCVLFLMTEFPQSILILLSIIIGPEFYSNVYLPMGDLIDMLALINNSINFLLYCTMSRAFRNTFYDLIVGSVCGQAASRLCSACACKIRCRRRNNINSNNFSYFTCHSAVNQAVVTTAALTAARNRLNKTDANAAKNIETSSDQADAQ
nr:G protein-coupled receptor [Proales similis]